MIGLRGIWGKKEEFEGKAERNILEAKVKGEGLENEGFGTRTELPLKGRE